MSRPRLRAYRADRPSLADEPKYFTRVPDDALEDPRLTDTTLRVFACLLKGNHTGEKVLYLSRAELARRARKSVRCIHDELVLLERCGYLRRDRDREKGGAPHCIVLCYELRPALKLEPGPPVAKGSRGASNRHHGADCNRHPRSGCNRHHGAGPSLFEQREPEETTTAVVENEPSSFLEVSTVQEAEPAAMLPSPPEPPDDPPDERESPDFETVVESAKERWPNDANIAIRAAELARRGLPETALAIEYATLKKAKSFGYVASTVSRWWNDGYDLVDIQAEVWGAKPKGAVLPRPAFYQRPAEPPPEKSEAARLQLEQQGWRSFLPAEPEKKSGCGSVGKLPPQPAGVHRQASHPSISEHTVKVCPRQESRESGPDGQRARLDSNQQPSDSKSQFSPTEPRPNSSTKTPDGEDRQGADSEKTLGLPIREFSRVGHVETPSSPSPHPTGRQEDA